MRWIGGHGEAEETTGRGDILTILDGFRSREFPVCVVVPRANKVHGPCLGAVTERAPRSQVTKYLDL